MVAALTLADVERNDTVNVLMRQGWRAREIAPVVDEVERRVRENATRSKPSAPLLAAVIAGLALIAHDPAMAASATPDAPWTVGVGGAVFIAACGAWVGGIFGLLAGAVACAARGDTYPVVIKRGRQSSCRLAVRESGIICLECGAEDPDGVIPPCSLGEWSR
jgi:hypothetical protein